MPVNKFQRQSFLGERGEKVFAGCKVALVGLCGGGSHVAQQLAHVGVGTFLIADADIVEDSNLNRLVGATEADVENRTLKVDVAKRLIHAVNPRANVIAEPDVWQKNPELFRQADIIFGCVDRYIERDQLEKFARRFLIPYIDIGMDVHPYGKRYSISGQVALSMPGEICLWCMQLLTEQLLTQEAAKYGEAGGRPQVVWPNGVLASTAVGIFVQFVTPWSDEKPPFLVEYDGNYHKLFPSGKLGVLNQRRCTHYKDSDVGDPFFKI